MSLFGKLFLTAVLFRYIMAITYEQGFSEWAVKYINYERSLKYIRPIKYSYKLSSVAKSRLIATNENRDCRETRCKKSIRRAWIKNGVEIDSGVHQDCPRAMEFLLKETHNLNIITNKLRWCEPWYSVGAFCQTNRVILRFSKEKDPRGKYISYEPNYFKLDSDPSCGKQIGIKINKQQNDQNLNMTNNIRIQETNERTGNQINYPTRENNMANNYHINQNKINQEKQESYERNNQVLKEESEKTQEKTINISKNGFVVPSHYPNDIHIFYALVNSKRKEFNLDPIPFSPELSKVAQAKSENMEQYLFKQANPIMKLHDWHGQYACEYYKNYDCMNKKPKLLSNYKGDGYEITFAGKGFDAETIFYGWMNSPGHRNVIMSSGNFEGAKWQAVGVGRTESMANIWFGYENDPFYPQKYKN